jgi:hypothetical protein
MDAGRCCREGGAGEHPPQTPSPATTQRATTAITDVTLSNNSSQPPPPPPTHTHLRESCVCHWQDPLSKLAVWSHPVDVCFATSSVAGWPTIRVEVCVFGMEGCYAVGALRPVRPSMARSTLWSHCACCDQVSMQDEYGRNELGTFPLNCLVVGVIGVVLTRQRPPFRPCTVNCVVPCVHVGSGGPPHILSAGYGAGFVPVSPGHHIVEIPCWRPAVSTSLTDRLSEWLLGGHPRLVDPTLVAEAGDRSHLHGVSTGSVVVRDPPCVPPPLTPPPPSSPPPLLPISGVLPPPPPRLLLLCWVAHAPVRPVPLYPAVGSLTSTL